MSFIKIRVLHISSVYAERWSYVILWWEQVFQKNPQLLVKVLRICMVLVGIVVLDEMFSFVLIWKWLKIFSFTGVSIQILWNFLIPFLLFLAQEVVPRIYKQLPHLFTSTPSIVIMHWNQSPFSQAPWTILWFLLIISLDLVEIAYLNWIPLIRNVLQLIWYLKKKFKSKNWWPLPGRNWQQIYSIY